MDNKLFSKATSRTKLVFINDNNEEERVTLTVSCDTHRKVSPEVLQEVERQLGEIRIRNYSKQDK